MKSLVLAVFAVVALIACDSSVKAPADASSAAAPVAVESSVPEAAPTAAASAPVADVAPSTSASAVPAPSETPVKK